MTPDPKHCCIVCGRLAWLEARIDDGSITPDERAEHHRLVTARRLWRQEHNRS